MAQSATDFSSFLRGDFLPGRSAILGIDAEDSFNAFNALLGDRYKVVVDSVFDVKIAYLFLLNWRYIDSFIPSFSHSVIHSFVPSFLCSFIKRTVLSFNHSFTD